MFLEDGEFIGRMKGGYHDEVTWIVGELDVRGVLQGKFSDYTLSGITAQLVHRKRLFIYRVVFVPCFNYNKNQLLASRNGHHHEHESLGVCTL